MVHVDKLVCIAHMNVLAITDFTCGCSYAHTVVVTSVHSYSYTQSDTALSLLKLVLSLQHFVVVLMEVYKSFKNNIIMLNHACAKQPKSMVNSHSEYRCIRYHVIQLSAYVFVCIIYNNCLHI